ncbi:MAG: discoidin domain-containing protein [Polyangiaceae bacterium]
MQIVRGTLARLWSEAAGKKREAAAEPARADRELLRRAQLALELARRTQGEPVEHGPAEAVACDLYCQAIYWGLVARRGASGEPEQSTLARELVSADPGLLQRCAGGVDESARLRARLEHSSFDALARLPAREQLTLLGELAAFADVLLDERNPERERIWKRRLLWTGAGIVLLSLLAIVWPRLRDRWYDHQDLARGKPWTASSLKDEGNCVSPAQRCDGGRGFFFHTEREKDPWLLIDLESPETISGVLVRNRRDCCRERAVPLVIQVSTDQEHWTEVARNDGEFGEWNATFAPVQARWVKLSVPRKSFLHLRRVRVLP